MTEQDPAGGARGVPTVVATLLCERDLEMGLRTMASLDRFSDAPVRFVVHDDGSLTPSSVRRLAAQRFDVQEVILRADADERLRGVLEAHPRVRRLRERQAYGLKLVDVPLLADDVVTYMDSDVLFLRPFAGLPQASGSVPAVFMPDHQNAYALGLAEVRDPRTAVARRVNSGLFSVTKDVSSPAAVERVLALDREVFWRYPWFEQTCWSMLALRSGGMLMSDRQVRVVAPDSELVGSGLIAAHFVSGTKERMTEIPEPEDDGAARHGGGSERIALAPMQRLGVVEYGFELGMRRLRRMRQRRRAAEHA